MSLPSCIARPSTDEALPGAEEPPPFGAAAGVGAGVERSREATTAAARTPRANRLVSPPAPLAPLEKMTPETACSMEAFFARCRLAAKGAKGPIYPSVLSWRWFREQGSKGLFYARVPWPCPQYPGRNQDERTPASPNGDVYSRQECYRGFACRFIPLPGEGQEHQ